jgi:predicted NAD/FAD-binding protein
MSTTSPTGRSPRHTVAVIGSGVSGLTAGWVLQRSHDVTLYEADDRLGGHAHTHDIADTSGATIAVDTGFIVHNESTYPILLRLFAELGVPTQESDMSMSVHCDECGLEYAGARGLGGLFAQPRFAISPRYLRMLGEVLRFHRAAKALLATTEVGGGNKLTLTQFLRQQDFSDYFVSHFMTPLVSSVWSSPPETSGDYPARYLFSFLAHHGMLSVTGSPPWRTVTGGSRTYVELAVKGLSAIHTSTPVRAIARHADGVDITDDSGQTLTYDAVVVSTHPDQALRMLADPTVGEAAVLAAFAYTNNDTVLHSDTSLLPDRRRAEASWNYRMPTCEGAADSVVVTYDMNRLQRLGSDRRYLVTLNGAGKVRNDLVIERMSYAHPSYTTKSVAAQSLLPALNQGRTAFAGAYHGWGFHEDGARAGLAAAESLGGQWC